MDGEVIRGELQQRACRTDAAIEASPTDGSSTGGTHAADAGAMHNDRLPPDHVSELKPDVDVVRTSPRAETLGEACALDGAPPPVLNLRVLNRSNFQLVNRVFERFPIVLGRDPTCDVPIDGIGQGARVSRIHARIDVLQGLLHVVDLDSSNGTFVDGRRLSPHVPVVLDGPFVFYIGPMCVIGWYRPERLLCTASPLRPIPLPLADRVTG